MNMEQPKKRGLFAMVMVALAVLAVVCVVTLKSTGLSNDSMLFGRRLGEEATKAENKMAFKAMKLNTKYELKSEQKTILRGGSVTDLANAAKAMKSNIYAGIKDMKKVVLEGLPGRNRASTPVVESKVEETKAEDQRREMPAVSVVKGAYKAMKGQIKTSMRTMKGLIMGTSDAGKWRKNMIISFITFLTKMRSVLFDVIKAIEKQSNGRDRLLFFDFVQFIFDFSTAVLRFILDFSPTYPTTTFLSNPNPKTTRIVTPLPDRCYFLVKARCH